ncbi:TetR/AcrR family transcriptional regulator [Aeromicrobium sp. NPDC092404]|uniref:TetR/AcrR family transcriptional regulator n=1 Tax=Aeromicrobium sp. NPDC092404 TaxID=3154976 RepID=UPI003416EADF
MRHRPGHSPRHAQLQTQLIELFLSEGFLGFSLDDLALRLRCSKSTLYTLAPSKEQLISTTVRSFFRRATERVEARVATQPDPVGRISTYLLSVSEELAPASPQFFADLHSMAPAREIYRLNTARASERVRELIRAATPEADRTYAAFVGAATAQVMEAIHRGDIRSRTGLSDSDAYRALADLVVAGTTEVG